MGPETLGRIMNVVGDPIDERGPIQTKKHYPIHREAPKFDEQGSGANILITGIKVVDLLAPYARGGKIGLFGGAGVGKTVVIQVIKNLFRNLLIILPRHMEVIQCLLVLVKEPEKETIFIMK